MVKWTTQGTPWRGLGFLGVLVVGGLAGCGLFDIRDPVTSSEGEVCPRVSTVDPDSVLVNVAQALACKVLGLSLYEESLSDSFHIVLDVNDVQELPGARDSLSKTEDVNAHRLAVDVPDSLFFAFDSMQPERTDTTAFYLDIPYELQQIRQEGDSLVVTTTVKGKAELFLANIEGSWAITRWIDEREAPFTSFGRWHAERAIFSAPRPFTGP